MALSADNTTVNKTHKGPSGEPCSKTSTHNCWPPKASRHIPKPRGAKKTKKVGAMMEQWIAQTADEGPWTALGCQGNAGFSPETATDEKKEG